MRKIVITIMILILTTAVYSILVVDVDPPKHAYLNKEQTFTKPQHFVNVTIENHNTLSVNDTLLLNGTDIFSLMDDDYLRLDTSNNPLTGDLTIRTGSPYLELVETGSGFLIEYRIKNNNGNLEFIREFSGSPKTIFQYANAQFQLLDGLGLFLQEVQGGGASGSITLRDSDIKILSEDDSLLNIYADGEIELASQNISLNGIVYFSNGTMGNGHDKSILTITNNQTMIFEEDVIGEGARIVFCGSFIPGCRVNMTLGTLYPNTSGIIQTYDAVSTYSRATAFGFSQPLYDTTPGGFQFRSRWNDALSFFNNVGILWMGHDKTQTNAWIYHDLDVQQDGDLLMKTGSTSIYEITNQTMFRFLNDIEIDSDKNITFNDKASIYHDGNNLIFDTNITGDDTSTTGLAWFSHNISTTGVMTRTQVNNDSNVLETFNLGNELLSDGEINHSAYGECYRQYDVIDKSNCSQVYSHTVYCYIFDWGQYQCGEILPIANYTLLSSEDKYNTVCGIKKEEAVDLVCENAKQRQALARLNEVIDIVENNTIDINTDVIADAYYTKSEVIDKDTDYLSKFTTDNYDDKSKHPSMELKKDISGNNIEVLSMEDRIVALEGAMIQLKQELEDLKSR